MNRQALDFYGEFSDEMKKYLRHNGWHFNKALFDFAVSRMKRKNGGRMEKVEPMTKERVEQLLTQNGIKLENSIGYDAAYVATMVKADFWGSSIEDDRHLALYVRDVIDDADQADGFVMNRWYADMVRAGVPVYWEDFV